MRILGIDYGDVKIGISVSDPIGLIAQSVETIKYTDINKALDRIIELVNKYNIETILVGMPKNMNNTLGPRAEKTEKFIDILKSKCTCNIVTWDERLSTVSAENLLISSNVRRDKRKKVIDKVASTFILQSYLDYLNRNKNSE